MTARTPAAKAAKKRWRERRAAKDAAQIAALRDAGARCGNCNSFEKHPHDRTKRICDFGSDFHGFQIATADGLCLHWSSIP